MHVSHTMLSDTVCSKDPRDQHYCFTYNKTVTTYQQLNYVLHGPCANKDCSDPTCNAAFKNVCSILLNLSTCLNFSIIIL